MVIEPSAIKPLSLSRPIYHPIITSAIPFRIAHHGKLEHHCIEHGPHSVRSMLSKPYPTNGPLLWKSWAWRLSRQLCCLAPLTLSCRRSLHWLEELGPLSPLIEKKQQDIEQGRAEALMTERGGAWRRRQWRMKTIKSISLIDEMMV